MEKLKKYQKIVRQTLMRHISSNEKNIREELIIDKEQQHFLILNFGWKQDEYSYLPIFHIELKENGQVWIHENRTDVAIEDDLVERGIEKPDLFATMISPNDQRLFHSEILETV